MQNTQDGLPDSCQIWNLDQATVRLGPFNETHPKNRSSVVEVHSRKLMDSVKSEHKKMGSVQVKGRRKIQRKQLC